MTASRPAEPASSPLLWLPGHELILDTIVRAENAHVFDATGKRYVDLESGVWCTSIGHGHPRVQKVLVEQAATFAHAGFNYTGEVVAEAAREILALLGLEGGRCAFLCTGSDAVEYGVRVARMVGDKPLLLTTTDAYGGAYGSVHARRGDEWAALDWLEFVQGQGEGDRDDLVFGDFVLDENDPRWAALPWDRIGGFFLEPGSSSGLVRFPPAALIDAIVDRIRRVDGFVLVNEVTTGIGRTGAWFGHQHYGITPDIVALGKGVGNGYPVAVAAVGPRVVERLAGRDVPFAQSHQNDPLGAVVAREVLRVIAEEDLVARGREIGAVLAAGLEEIAAGNDRIRAVRSRGLMAAVDLVDDAADDDGRAPLVARLHRELVDRGYLVGRRPGIATLRLDPPLTIERADIDGFLTTFADVLATTS